MTHKMFFAGSGGQGTLLIGQVITYAAMYENKEVTFLPSYGPEMRGGTANCTVIVSDKPISCPLINEADEMVVMNYPSLERFEPMIKPGGKLFINKSLVPQDGKRSDIDVYGVHIDEMATELGNRRTANIIMLGAFVRKTGVVSMESVKHVLETKVFVGKKAALLDMNLKALELYEG